MDPRDLPGGGPAFPTENGRQVGNNAYLYEGMTLRDYFAAKAMQAHTVGRGDFADSNKRTIAECAYDMADAMLAARG